MTRLQLAIMFAAALTTALAQDVDSSKQEIENLLTSQDAAWNAADIEGFMQTYWKSEELTFSGGGKTTRGWQATLDKYKESYPKGSMGKLNFDGLETTVLSDSIAIVLGNWHLDDQGKKRDGNFSLVMRKIDGNWKIIHDHSSTLEKEKGWLTEEQSENILKSHFTDDAEIEFAIDGLQMTALSKDRKAVLNRKTGMIDLQRE